MSTPSTHTKPSSFRFSARVLEVADQIAEMLGTNRTTAFSLAITELSERLGVKQLDAVAAVESITRAYGDDAGITVTVTAWDTATIEIAGRPAPDWTAWPLVALSDAGEPLSKVGFYCRYEPTRTTFALGDDPDAAIGSSVTVRPAELLDLVLLRTKRDSDKTPAQIRAELRSEFELRRQVARALGEGDG